MQYPESGSSFNGLGLASGELLRESFEGLRKVLLASDNNSPSPSPSTDSPTRPIPLPCFRVVDIEMTETYLHKARDLGLSEDWISRIIACRTRRPVTASLDDSGTLADLDADIEHMRLSGESSSSYDSSDEDDVDDSTDPHTEILTPKYAFVTVRRVPAWPITTGSGSLYPGVANENQALREGDLILTINGRLVVHMRDLMQVISDRDQVSDKPVLLRIFRDGVELEVLVPTRLLSGAAEPEVVQWAGALFQLPHRAIQFHTKFIPRGVYTSLLYSGSPAQRDGVTAAWFLVDIDGKPIHDLRSLIEAVEGDEAGKVPVVDPIGKEGWSKADAEDEKQAGNKVWETRSYRVKMVSLELVQKVVTVEVCAASKIFWPTFHAKSLAKL